MKLEPYKRILVAVDFSSLTPAVVARAQLISSFTGAQLECIHVVEIPTYPVLEDLAVMGTPGLWDAEIAENILESANNNMNTLSEKYELVKTKVMTGIASKDICDYACQQSIDLIVMGSHGVGSLSDLNGWRNLIGSTTSEVINHANCEVLLVRNDK